MRRNFFFSMYGRIYNIWDGSCLALILDKIKLQRDIDSNLEMFDLFRSRYKEHQKIVISKLLKMQKTMRDSWELCKADFNGFGQGFWNSLL